MNKMKTYSSLILVCAIFFTNIAFANEEIAMQSVNSAMTPTVSEGQENVSNVRLLFRTIAADSSNPEFNADEQIVDLHEKLSNLPYKKYRLLEQRELSFPLGQKHVIAMEDGDVVSIKVLYQNKDRVGIWYDWTDVDGHELIDTKLHFSCNKSFVTAVDAGNGEGKLLAIKLIQ